MKHFSKIVLGSVLSVAMVLSAGFATANYKKVSAYEVPTTVQTSLIAENVVATKGHATWVKDKAQVGNGKKYSGIRLTGESNAVFNLGVIDLNEASYWNGPDHAPASGEGAYDSDYQTAAGVDFKSFIGLVYDPTSSTVVAANSTSAMAELGYFDVKLTSITDSTEYVTIRINQNKRSDDTSGNAIAFEAMATNNDTKYAERNRSDGLYLSQTASKAVNAFGNQVSPMEFAYDSGAVYSPITFNAPGLEGSYCIRNFSNPATAYIAADQAKHTQWAGFTAAADGSIKVKVDIIFGTVKNANSGRDDTSIIVTSFNGYDFASETQTLKTSDYVEELSYNVANAGKGEVTINAPVAKHINNFVKVAIPNSYAKIYVEGNETNADTLNFTSASAKYNFKADGTYVLDFYNDADQKLGTQKIVIANYQANANGVKTSYGATATVGSFKQLRANGTYVDGLQLKGGVNATFDLGTIDLSKSNWEGTATTITGAPTSFFDFVYDWQANTDIKNSELESFTLRLTDVVDASKYVDITLRPGNSGYKMVHSIRAKANNQSQFGAFRNKTTPTLIVPGNFVTKSSINSTTATALGLDEGFTVDCISNGSIPFSLVFDVEDNALYSPVTFSGIAELDSSYAIRDFDEAYNVNDATWDGFSKDANGKVLVNATITFGSVINADETAIVITKISSYDYSKGVVADANESVVEQAENNRFAKANKEYTINAPVSKNVAYTSFVANSKAVITKNEAPVAEITFDEATKPYTFTEQGDYVIKFVDANGDAIGEDLTVSVVDGVGVVANIQGGKAYYKRGDAEKEEITGATILKAGDVVTVEGGVHELTGDDILDVRSFIVNGEEKATIVENVATQIDGFSYVVTQTDEDKDVFNLTVKLDNYCDVTFIDEYVDENVVSYAWQSNGEVSFPYASSQNPAIKTGASDDGAALIAYERKNAEAYKSGSDAGWTIWRSYDNKIGKDTNDGDSNLEQYECLTKGMVFEALYLKAEIISEYNAETKKLSIYLAVEQAGADKWNAVMQPTGEKAKLNLGYLVTDKTASEPVCSVSNTKTIGAYQVGGAYVPLVNGYYRYNLGEVTTEGKNLQITGYATLSTAQGGVTAGIAHKNTTYVKEAQDKIANAGILSSEAGNGYLYAVNVGGVNKYSKLTLTDLKGLYTYAGDTTTITAWVNE